MKMLKHIPALIRVMRNDDFSAGYKLNFFVVIGSYAIKKIDAELFLLCSPHSLPAQ